MRFYCRLIISTSYRLRVRTFPAYSCRQWRGKKWLICRRRSPWRGPADRRRRNCWQTHSAWSGATGGAMHLCGGSHTPPNTWRYPEPSGADPSVELRIHRRFPCTWDCSTFDWSFPWPQATWNCTSEEFVPISRGLPHPCWSFDRRRSGCPGLARQSIEPRGWSCILRAWWTTWYFHEPKYRFGAT